MSFIPRFQMGGGSLPSRSYAIAASEEWDVYDIVALNGARALLEPTDDSSDIIGAALGNVGNSTTGQSDANDLRPYIAALTTGKHEPVAVMTYSTVFETDNPSGTAGSAAAANVGTVNDLDLVAGVWGILLGTSATANTPNFSVLDIEETRGTFLVIPSPLDLVDVFQFFDAAA